MTHKAILIDPVARTVTEVDQEGGLQPLYDRLSCEGFRPCNDINAVMVAPRQAMYVDGEGLLIENLPMFTFIGSGQQGFAGRGLIVGTNDEGDDVDHGLPVDSVRESVVWLDLITTGDLGPGGFVDPAGATILGMEADAVYRVGAPILKDKDEL